MIQLKVCGMRDAANIVSLAAVSPDYIGFIFYPPSPRHITEFHSDEVLQSLPRSTQRVGVFVSPTAELVGRVHSHYHLNYVQLHGAVSHELLEYVRGSRIGIIRAIPISDHLPVDIITNAVPYADMFVFDYKTPKHGGSGQKFDWSLLRDVPSLIDTPIRYLLSGGITADDGAAIREHHTNGHLEGMIGVDINSKFEISPGLKDIDAIKRFKQDLHR